jgi:hypothetical protein
MALTTLPCATALACEQGNVACSIHVNAPKPAATEVSLLEKTILPFVRIDAPYLFTKIGSFVRKPRILHHVETR